MQNVIVLNVVMQNVIVLNVVALIGVLLTLSIISDLDKKA